MSGFEQLLAGIGLLIGFLVFAACATFLLLIVASVPVSIWRFLRTTWLALQIRRAPLLTIEEIEAGSHGRIVGRIAAIGNPLQAPLSGRECAYYKVVVEVWLGDIYSTYWKILEEEKSEDFVLQDPTGRILVDMSEARVLAAEDASYRSGRFHDAAPNLEAFLTRHGHKSTGFLGFNKSLRYRESILGYDEPIAAVGTAQTRNDGLAFGATKKTPVRVSDSAGVG